MKLYNAKLQFIGADLFQFQFSFENEKGVKDDVVKSSLGATIRVGDTKAVIAWKLRRMAQEIEIVRETEDKIAELVAHSLLYFERLDQDAPNFEFLSKGDGWLTKYNNDPMFRAKVLLLTTKIMGVIES